MDKITILRYPGGDRGRMQIMVGDFFYGTIHADWHGGNGTSYFFRQAGSSSVIRRKRGTEMVIVRVFGDAMAWQMRKSNTRVASFAKRLLIEARKLVKEGLLVSEAEHRNRVAKQKQEYKEQQEQREAEANAEFVVRANKAIFKALPMNSHVVNYDELRKEVVEAMKWAQSQ